MALAREASHIGMGYRIERARDFDACRATVEIQEETWGRDLVIPPSVLLSATHEGGYVGVGYTDEDTRPAGFVFGFQGSHEGRLRHHSQRLAVRESHRHSGLAQALKEAQRAHCLAEGVDTITWTMDPLQPRNARFNLGKLGAIARTYHEDFYGTIADRLNPGLPTDRLYLEWPITTDRVRRRLTHTERLQSLDDAEEAATYILRIDRGSPRAEAATADVDRLLLEVPADIHSVKGRDAKLAVEWRLASRAAFVRAFCAGYVAIDLVRSRDGTRGAYLLGRTVPGVSDR